MSWVGRIIYSTHLSKEKVEKYQQIIRDKEWEWLKKEIPENANFLDVGCGTGYAMFKALTELNCSVHGIDPDPGAHGVGRYLKDLVKVENIKQGFAENLPFNDNEFDIVFSSHVLEHVNDEMKSLQEMKRVLKDDGLLLIGMPTRTMAIINLCTNIVFTTHIKIYEFIRNIFSKDIFKYFLTIFKVGSHSFPRANSIWYDLKHYSVKNWKKTIEKEFQVIKVLEPYLYPYPEYPQLFKIHHSKLGASSVFFICKKK